MPSTYPANIEFIQTGIVTNADGEAKNIVNRFTYAITSIVTPGYTLTSLLTGFVNIIGTAWPNMLNVGYVAHSLTVRVMDLPTNPPFFSAGLLLPSGAFGTTATALPPDVTAFCKLQTALRGKSYRGSKHISPLDSGMITNGELSGAAQTKLGLLYAALCTPFTDSAMNTWTPTVQSQIQSQVAVLPVAIVANAIVQSLGYGSRTLGTQRHRRFATLRL
jgi:hypothetical protein